MEIREEFDVHLLNESGVQRARLLAEAFSKLLDRVEEIVADSGGRELALVRTKLQEASFFAKRAMAQKYENQKH